MDSPQVVSEAERDERLVEWAGVAGVEVGSLDPGQRAVVFAAITFLAFVGTKLFALRRMVAYLLSHCGMGLSTVVIGAVMGTTDRAVRKGRGLPPREFWDRLQKARRGHPPPKLRRDQVGPVAKYLAEHKDCTVNDLLGFIQTTFAVQMDRLTLRRFLKRYGLGCLRDETVAESPLLSAAPPTEVRSS
jgi:transposase